MNLLSLLQKKKFIDGEIAKRIENEVRSSGKKPDEVILEGKYIAEDVLFETKSELLSIPLKRIEVEEVPLKILQLIPEDSVRYYRMAPIARENNILEVGMVYPDDLKAQEALKFLARQGNFKYETSLITQSTFDGLLKQYRNLKGEVEKALEDLEEEIEAKSGQDALEDAATKKHLVEEAPITKMVAVIVRNAVEGAASDIHIEPLEDKIRVRFRSMGELHSSLFLPIEVHQAIIARIKILSNMKIDEMRIPQDGRFSTAIEGKHVDFRVSTFPTPLGEKVAIRVLDPDMGMKSFDDLGLEGDNLKKVKEAAKKPFGLILVTGPTGSGKSTTLYSVLQFINKESINIVSLEDPVEYFIAGVNQSQIRPEIGYDFAQGLRQILRQDPDVIMVGEVRDAETAQLVIHSALTGHVVLSTLHTNTAVGVVPRLLDMGVDKFLLPATLNVALAQRLVRRLCDQCREKVKPEKAIRNLIKEEVEELPDKDRKRIQARIGKDGEDIAIFHPKGCKKCGVTGFVGRVGIFEVLSISDQIAELLLRTSSEIEIGKIAKAEGMRSMRQDGMIKVLDGVTTMEEIIRVTTQ